MTEPDYSDPRDSLYDYLVDEGKCSPQYANHMLDRYKQECEIRTAPGQHVIIAINDTGEQTDITENTKIMYDAIIGSLDWGSGFLSTEDAEAIAAVGHHLGLDMRAVDSYVRHMKYINHPHNWEPDKQIPPECMTCGMSKRSHDVRHE